MRKAFLGVLFALLLFLLGGCAIPVDIPPEAVWYCEELNMYMDTHYRLEEDDGKFYQLEHKATRYYEDGTFEDLFYGFIPGGWINFYTYESAYQNGALNSSLKYKEGEDRFTLKVSLKERYVFIRQTDETRLMVIPPEAGWYCEELNMYMDTHHHYLEEDDIRYQLMYKATRSYEDGTSEDILYEFSPGGTVSFNKDYDPYLNNTLSGYIQYEEGADGSH